jgi:hypothetical protein
MGSREWDVEWYLLGIIDDDVNAIVSEGRMYENFHSAPGESLLRQLVHVFNGRGSSNSAQHNEGF